MEKVSLYVSSVVAVGVIAWSAYAQAHAIPFVIDDVTKAVILAPYTRALYRLGREKVLSMLKKKEE